jgi:DNA topoisomerase I
MDGMSETSEEEIRDELAVARPVEAAGAAGLSYIEEGQPGFTRRRRGRGFAYYDSNGQLVTDAELRERFDRLVIPPAWRSVWICPDPFGHIQATGRDDRGRKQYLYHPAWDELRNQVKFGRMRAFGQALPMLRAQIDQDLRRSKLDRTRVVALVVSLMEDTLIRVGNPEYARMHSSYGLTTMLDDHAAVVKGRVLFAFTGKSGKPHAIELHDPRLARLVKRCQELPGQRLFQYVDDTGACCLAVTSGDVNEYLRAITGQDFSAKDFRTWGGTVLAAAQLDEARPPESEKAADKQIVQAVRVVAIALGNTPATCRKYYIHPAVIDGYRSGQLFSAMEAGRQPPEDPAQAALSPAERGVMALLS